jgi:hypothetical protein
MRDSYVSLVPHGQPPYLGGGEAEVYGFSASLHCSVQRGSVPLPRAASRDDTRQIVPGRCIRATVCQDSGLCEGHERGRHCDELAQGADFDSFRVALERPPGYVCCVSLHVRRSTASLVSAHSLCVDAKRVALRSPACA